MNYYIQGDAAKADQINAAFKKLGYDTSGHLFNANSVLYFTLDGEIRATTCNCTPAIIKTHPDYQELELPVQPKFKVGDWVVCNRDSRTRGKITSVVHSKKDPSFYGYDHTGGYFTCDNEDNYHLWTIQDAKDGDVLVTEDYIFIFKYILHGGVHLYCHYNIDDEEFDSDIPDAIIGNIHDKGAHFRPATKEQRDLLFKKMKEAGYQWDSDNKELHKIQSHYDITNFYAGMPVLVRDNNGEEWRHTAFSHMTSRFYENKFAASCTYWCQCIPFNDDTKHLLGTTDMCDEQYINW